MSKPIVPLGGTDETLSGVKRAAETPAQRLFDAALTASQNLSTSMNLSEHPQSCECYGCGLSKAVVDYAMKRAWESTREIRELEAKAETPQQGLMEMRLDSPAAETGTEAGRVAGDKIMRHALVAIRDGDDACGCDCGNDPDCCVTVGEYCPHCIATHALAAQRESEER